MVVAHLNSELSLTALVALEPATPCKRIQAMGAFSLLKLNAGRSPSATLDNSREEA